MRRLTIAVLCAAVARAAIAAEEGQVAPLTPPVPIIEQPVAASAPVPAPAPVAAASATPATSAAPAPAPANPVSSSAAAPAPTLAGPRSGVPPQLRQGADATKCLELSSDKEIAACAEKYR